ncbi:MAG: hypothetical protein HY720_06960 [Planctomycetes bacterium]|nr:hypothetical protein [Planctomycetota bacterium]
MPRLRVVEMEFAEVVKTARSIAARLSDMGVPYLITGGLAVFQHGYRRTTSISSSRPRGSRESTRSSWASAIGR